MTPVSKDGRARRLQLAGIAVLVGIVLATNQWKPGAPGEDRAAARSAWSGPVLAGPEPGTLRLQARLGDDQADVYWPAPTSQPAAPPAGPPFPAPGPLPVALLLQGANVDKGHYSTFAALLARQGFVVVVPNHWRTFPPIPLLGRRLLLADQRQLSTTLAALRQLHTSAPAPLRGVIDSGRLVVVGHSMGGLAGIEALANRCRFPLCVGFVARPTELRGGVFIGTDLRGHGGGAVGPIDTNGLPVALIRGSRDGASTAAAVQATWRQLRTPRRELLTIGGANHYAITNNSQPANPPDLPPIRPDPQAATTDQRATLERIAEWSGRFLREAVGEAPK